MYCCSGNDILSPLLNGREPANASASQAVWQNDTHTRLYRHTAKRSEYIYFPVRGGFQAPQHRIHL